MVRHRPEPDVGVDAGLVRGVATEHRAAARLRHVADENAGVMRGLPHAVGEPFDEGDELWVAIEAVARGTHHLPVRPVEGERMRAGNAAAGIGAVDVRRACRRLQFSAEHLLGRQMGIGRIGERLRPTRIERAAVLRQTIACRDASDHDE